MMERNVNYFLDINYSKSNAIELNNWMNSVFISYGIKKEDLFPKVTCIVTDGGGDARKSRTSIANYLNVLNVHCILHQFNLLFNAGFDKIKEFKYVLKIIRTLRSLKYNKKFKKHCNSKSIKLKRYVDTRWCSITFCFESFLKNYDRIKSFVQIISNELQNEKEKKQNQFENEKKKIKNIIQRNEQIDLFLNILGTENSIISQINKIWNEKNFLNSLKIILQNNNIFSKNEVIPIEQTSSNNTIHNSNEISFQQSQNLIKDQFEKLEKIEKSLKSTEEELKTFLDFKINLESEIFHSKVAILFDILLFEKETINSLQGNNLSIIDYYEISNNFISFVQENTDHFQEKYFSKFNHFHEISSLIPENQRVEVMSYAREYISLMNKSLKSGSFGVGERFTILKEIEDLYFVASHPLTCDEKCYSKLIEKNIVSLNDIRLMKSKISSDYEEMNIFTLSNFIKNQTLQIISCFLSSLKMTSYDVEQSFSSMKRIKTENRFNMKDETLRNLMFIKYNFKSIEFDYNEFYEMFSKKELEYSSTFQKTIDEFSKTNDKVDVLLGGDHCSKIMEKDVLPDEVSCLINETMPKIVDSK